MAQRICGGAQIAGGGVGEVSSVTFGVDHLLHQVVATGAIGGVGVVAGQVEPPRALVSNRLGQVVGQVVGELGAYGATGRVEHLGLQPRPLGTRGIIGKIGLDTLGVDLLDQVAGVMINN